MFNIIEKMYRELSEKFLFGSMGNVTRKEMIKEVHETLKDYDIKISIVTMSHINVFVFRIRYTQIYGKDNFVDLVFGDDNQIRLIKSILQNERV